MRILAVFAHPSHKSFNGTLLDALGEVAAAKEHEFRIRDLYGERFDPVLTEADYEAFNRSLVPADIRHEQEAVSWAEVVVFIHPIWWFGSPAILKGWIERVFCYGFAYGHDSRGVKPLLSGKKAIVVNSAGSPEVNGYDDTGFKDAIIKLNDIGIYKFVGFDLLLRRMFFEVSSASDSARREMVERWRQDLQRIL